MKVAIFCRVSSKSDRQDTERQKNDLTRMCESNKWEVVELIEERISGKTKTDKRPKMQHLLNLAATKQIKKVVISEISRLGRNVKEGIEIIEELSAMRVSIYIANIGMETLKYNGEENVMFKPILITMMGYAQMESELMSERIRSGLKAAKKKGVVLGRRKGATKDIEQFLSENKKVVKELRSGTSIRKTAKICDCSPSNVQKVKKALQEKGELEKA